MHLPPRTSLLAGLLLLSMPLHAQVAADPSGHWEGVVQAPTPLTVEIDLAKNNKGELVGAMSVPAQNVKGLPLSGVTIEASAVRFHLGNMPGDRAFKGALSADGTTMSGDYTQGGHSMPFTLTRKGDARIEPPARSAAISKELEGTWNGTVSVNGMQMRVVLKMSNQPDGTSTGSIANLDQGGIEVPIAITQTASSLALDVKAIGGSYAGVLNPERTELAGTWTQGALVARLTLQRAAATEDKR